VLVPELAYQFIAGTDTAGPTFQIFSHHEARSTGLVIVDILISNIPKDRILVLNNASMRSDPGVGQNCIELALQGITQAGQNFRIFAFDAPGTADVIEALNWQGDVWIPGGGDGRDSVRIFGSFSSGANANTITVGLHGKIIPRGNAGAF